MTTVTADNLNEVMEFDHVIEVHPDGTVTDGPNLSTDELVWQDVDADGSARGEPTVGDSDWELLTGYTSQYGYRGASMHPSEFIGGGMAQDILATPGVYVALVIECRFPDERWHICAAGSSVILDTVTAPSAADALTKWSQDTGNDPDQHEASSAEGDSEEPAGWCVARYLG